MMGFPYVTLLPGFVENQLGSAAESSSILFGVSAFGGLVSGLLVARLAASARAAALFSGMALAFGVSLLGVSLAPSFIVVAAIMLVVGVVSGGFQTLAGAVIIRHTEPAYVGRVMSLTMLSYAGFGLMSLPVGYLADAFGERWVFVGMSLVVSGLVIWLQGAIRRLPGV
jgi:predicted MFS family arabinose efflux permease